MVFKSLEVKKNTKSVNMQKFYGMNEEEMDSIIIYIKLMNEERERERGVITSDEAFAFSSEASSHNPRMNAIYSEVCLHMLQHLEDKTTAIY